MKNTEKYQTIIQKISTADFTGAKNIIEDLFIERISEKISEKKNEIMAKIKKDEYK